MDKRLAISGMVAVALSTAAISHHLSVSHPKCEMHYKVGIVEDSYCAAYWQGDSIIIGPLSSVDGQHIVGSPD